MRRLTVEQVNKKVKLLGPYGPNDIFKNEKGYEKVPGVKFSPKQMSFYFLRKMPNGKS